MGSKIASLLAAAMIVMMMAGCASGSASSADKDSSAESGSAASLSSSSLTDEQKNELLDYLQSSQKTELDSAIEEANDGLTDLIQNKDASEIDHRSLVISEAVKNAEGMDVPAICETLHYNKVQCGRAMFIALADYSAAMAGGSDSKAKLDEAGEYLNKATEFTKAYDEEIQRLTEMAK